jgi:tRNA U34 5-methylaminomethyl-2-thiouridine-forming methyltransferase MnmC
LSPFSLSPAGPSNRTRIQPDSTPKDHLNANVQRFCLMQPSRKIIPIENHDLAVQVTDDQSRTLIVRGSQVAYHSGSGACSETRHVYLNNSGVADRLASGQATSVLEIGLGTGMGMLLTLDTSQTSGTPLSYTAIEYRWLDAELLRTLKLTELLEDPSIVERYLRWRESIGQPRLGEQYRWQAGPTQCVVVEHRDALDWVATARSTYDAIYFDPFAPDTNPHLWTTGFLAKMRGLLHDDGRLVTYCVSRAVRDAFTSAGFGVARVPGPTGGKREVMIATLAKTKYR